MSTKKTAPKATQPAISEAAEKLLRAYADANFESGEWRENESDEPCESVSQKVDEASRVLKTYIADLEAKLAALGQTLPTVEPSLAELRTTVAEKEYETYDFEGDVYDYSDWGRDGPDIWTRTIELSREVLPKMRRSTKVTLYVCFGKGLIVKKVHARDAHGDLVGKRCEPVSAL